jgi:hypothetical protein
VRVDHTPLLWVDHTRHLVHRLTLNRIVQALRLVLCRHERPEGFFFQGPLLPSPRALSMYMILGGHVNNPAAAHSNCFFYLGMMIVRLRSLAGLRVREQAGSARPWSRSPFLDGRITWSMTGASQASKLPCKTTRKPGSESRRPHHYLSHTHTK